MADVGGWLNLPKRGKPAHVQGDAPLQEFQFKNGKERMSYQMARAEGASKIVAMNMARAATRAGKNNGS
jgi:hypothetical protein